MTQEVPSTGNLADELRALGENLHRVLRAVWESDDRVRLQQELETGLADLTRSLRSAATDFAASETGRRLAQDVRDLERRLQSGEAEAKARQDLTEMLRRLNAELEKAAQQWSGRGAPPEDVA